MHEFKPLTEGLAEGFGVRVAFDSYDFDLVVLVLFGFELFEEVVFEVVDLDLFGDDCDAVVLGVELFGHCLDVVNKNYKLTLVM